MMKTKLDRLQKNNLLTGTQLAVELRPTSSEYRKFLSVYGYNYNENGDVVSLSKFLKSSEEERYYFEIRCYEIPKVYYENNWDVDDSILINSEYIRDIKGIKSLENNLEKYLPDFSVLKPSSQCDNLF